MNACRTYSNAKIPMLEIFTTNNKCNSSGKPTGNSLPLLPYKWLEKQNYLLTCLLACLLTYLLHGAESFLRS